MAAKETVAKLKTDLRISHSALDDDVADQVNACLADLTICGVVNPDENDPLILNALKLWVRAYYTTDTAKASAYMARYDALKSCLMMAGGYGGAE